MILLLFDFIWFRNLYGFGLPEQINCKYQFCCNYWCNTLYNHCPNSYPLRQSVITKATTITGSSILNPLDLRNSSFVITLELKLLLFFPDIIHHQCFSMADIQNPIFYYRMRKMFFGSGCDFEFADQIHFSGSRIYKIHFTTLIVVIE